ncbi:glycosyltransferase family 2 protein [Cellvibrio sp. KY-YJ-3]|uniref:glycosyltransferase n=1 Tax=Cellvibrio sp. KY-YJ-3 TaxID=454662 RepID=UPI0012484B96|nr:glycosyltransferase [Cellvibrio sp. KY-YJ-3]QEY11293.1 glycosyltransferase [Cellvibrio sp. KY-YJ-3]
MSINDDYQFVSIVMPAFNEEKYISEALEAVLELDYPKDRYEIIVVDNGSKDATVSIARKYTEHVYVVPNVRVGAVRNYGVRKSKGDIVAFLDSDCIPPKNWIKDTLVYMRDNGCDAVGGLGLVRDDPSWIESSWILNQVPLDKPSRILAGAAIIMKKCAFLEVGGFNEVINAGEDTLLASDLIENGKVVHFAKSCAVIHLGYPQDLKTFITRQYWQASSYLKSRKKNTLDIVFYIVALFLASALVTPLFFFIFPMLGLISLVLLLILPMILSLKRIISSRYRSLRFDSYLKIYFLDFCYLVGRSAGLLKSLLVELKVFSDKKQHY